MRIKITFKTPDAVNDAICGAVHQTPKVPGISNGEWVAVKESRVEALMHLAGEWFTYHEYVTIEWDTETNTCTVVPG